MKSIIALGTYDPRNNRGRHKRSWLEISFEDWLKINNIIDFDTEHHVVKRNEQGNYLKSYYIDFYFPNLKLGIELDGTQHKNTVEADQVRDSYIESLGIKIIRITHKEYINQTKLELIKKLLGIGAA
jgi:Protein of unknown function (DUF559)